MANSTTRKPTNSRRRTEQAPPAPQAPTNPGQRAKQVPQAPTSPAEEIWAILRRSSEMQEEHNRRWKESDVRWKESDARWERLEINAEKDRQAAEKDRQAAEKDRQAAEKDRQESARYRAESAKAREAADHRMEQMSIDAEKDRQESAQYRAEMEKDRKEMRKHMKDLSNLFRDQWGTFMESLVEGDLAELLAEWGMQVETHPNKKVKDSNKRIIAEFDIIAANGKEVVVVEVKTTLNSKDVEKFSKKMDRIKELLPKYADKRIYGAMAYLKCKEGADAFAMRKGFFVIRATGSSASIVNEENFKPRDYYAKSSKKRSP